MPLYYVTRDIERALGVEPNENYRIITNADAYAESIRVKYPEHVFLIERASGASPLDTYDLLAHPETTKIISASVTASVDVPKDIKDVSILVFKNTSRIETLCKEKGWKLLNPSSILAEKIENKITQAEWLGTAARYLLPHEIVKIADISTSRTTQNTQSTIVRPFIIQWAHGHTGDGTVLVPAGTIGDKILTNLKEKFPDRESRVTGYVRGPVFTANVCVNAGDVLVGNISYQITGMLPFTDNPFATVGNDWSLPHTVLDEKKLTEFAEIAEAVGQRMRGSGWTGLFGIDCIHDEERDSLHLIEVNARQPASATYESQLQGKIRSTIRNTPEAEMTVFEAHVAALSGPAALTGLTTLTGEKNPFAGALIVINDGAQIIDRVKGGKTTTKTDLSKIEGKKAVEELCRKKYTVIEYEGGKSGADHIRIQSERGIMSAHNAFNSRGKEILAAVSSCYSDKP